MRKEQIARLSLSNKLIDNGFAWKNAAEYSADIFVTTYHETVKPSAKFRLKVAAPIDADRIISHGHKLSKRGIAVDSLDIEKIIKRACDVC
ncbi:MAG: hypothetical protein JWQ02_231 [Capsulimonas sp.]|nr:hypothetical protein [Capsulimonas sp.]